MHPPFIIVCDLKASIYLQYVFQDGPQRKKRKSEAGQAEEKADLLAMGTAAGSVLIYSAVKGALHCTLVSPGLDEHPCIFQKSRGTVWVV